MHASPIDTVIITSLVSFFDQLYLKVSYVSPTKSFKYNPEKILS